MKTLLSWLAFNRDFEIEQNVVLNFKPGDFTGTLLKDIYDHHNFDRHVVLSIKNDSEGLTRRIEFLKRFARDQYPKVKMVFQSLEVNQEDLQDFGILESALRSHIQSYDADCELTVVAGSGPTALNMAWSSLSLAMPKRFKLYLLQRPEHTSDGKRSKLVEILPYVSVELDNKLRELHLNEEDLPPVYADEIVKKEYQKAKMIAQGIDVNVLVLGETGCGKDVLSEYIFKNSPLKSKPYKAINCASLPDDILYSELFGHEIGAFTGATSARIGLFEECKGGTLFLDEIGDISKYMQQSLLRAIENKEVKRLGSNKIISNIDVRIIAATNNNLYEKCKREDFRWDLYYRLCSMEINLTPYRERNEAERTRILNHFLKVAEKKWARKITMSEGFKSVWNRYSFPGNFREILNTINGLFSLGKDVVEELDLPKRFFDSSNEVDDTYKGALKRHCKSIFEKYNRDLAKTCKALGYQNQTQMKTKFQDLGILEMIN